ncbi:inactive protein RESTRICTED TEV MOVEMENT 1-like [Ipomoea triloba]|uniref:inactive protein RESTRICTED TEV MOVEMENT 1-like n=1 Tax=Ipomoea triloba TaxID=35885 RepID=UPI00125D1DF2|nr:inactive protein RESTRICTED TEV MOVEMENT 1-like [Ipomoea triloba]
MMFKVDLVCAGNGNPWDDHSLGQVVGIVISYTSTNVYTLRFLYVKDNIQQMSEEHGNCTDGENSEMILLEYPTEFLTAVRGVRHRFIGSFAPIKSLTFVTNKATYGPFGQPRSVQHDIDFGFKISANVPRNWISGFYGTVYRGYIEGLGVYVQSPTTSQPDESIRQWKPEL